MASSTSRLSPETVQNRITSEELLEESENLDKQSNSETLENQDQSISNQENEENEDQSISNKEDEETEDQTISNKEDEETEDKTISNKEDEETEELEAHKEDEETECGFCLFMKGGGCKEPFIDWEKCIEEAEKNKEDIVSKCFDVTTLLKKCMEAHAEYYEPILQAEKTMEEEAVRELEREKIESSVKEEK